MKENLHLVEKASNLPNVLQTRPIENLWGILAQEVYEGEWQASTHQELISRIQSQLKKFELNLKKKLMGNVKTNLRAIAGSGVLATYKK